MKTIGCEALLKKKVYVIIKVNLFDHEMLSIMIISKKSAIENNLGSYLMHWRFYC